eukprot:880890-Rhodomonas_salina.2
MAWRRPQPRTPQPATVTHWQVAVQQHHHHHDPELCRHHEAVENLKSGCERVPSRRGVCHCTHQTRQGCRGGGSRAVTVTVIVAANVPPDPLLHTWAARQHAAVPCRLNLCAVTASPPSLSLSARPQPPGSLFSPDSLRPRES